MFDISDLRGNYIYKSAEDFVLNLINEYNYPKAHPFREYPNSPGGMTLMNIIILKMLNIDENVIADMIKKCKAVENKSFNYDKFRQGVNEVLFLYYILIHLVYQKYSIPQILYEDENIIENEKKPEYSLVFDEENEKIMMNIEVKTLSCEALPDGKITDGQQLIMPYYKDKDFIEQLRCDYPEAIILEDKCCLYQLERNIKKIQKKFLGKPLTEIKMFNVGVIFIDRASSIEQFHSYLFNEKFGLYSKTDFTRIDALVIMTLDAKVDMHMSNIYNLGYVQVFLLNDDEKFKNLCNKLRLDNYIGIRNMSPKSVIENAKKEFEHLKILKRQGFINIIPFDTSEEEIEEYLTFLKGDITRKMT